MKKQIVAPCGIACFNCELYCENVTIETQNAISRITNIPPENLVFAENTFSAVHKVKKAVHAVVFQEQAYVGSCIGSYDSQPVAPFFKGRNGLFYALKGFHVRHLVVDVFPNA